MTPGLILQQGAFEHLSKPPSAISILVMLNIGFVVYANLCPPWPLVYCLQFFL